MNKKNNLTHSLLFTAFFVIGGGLFIYSLYIHPEWKFPNLGSKEGSVVDKLFNILFIEATIMFIGFVGLLCYFLIAFLKRNENKREYVDGNSKGAIILSVGLGVLVVIMLELTSSVIGSSFWTNLHKPIEKNEQIIEITGQQFTWNVRYSGEDGKFGKNKPELIDDAGGNPLGIDFEDSTSKDDVVLSGGEIHVPLNKSTIFLLRSKDVIHDLFIPNFRVQSYATPGMNVMIRFTPVKTGEFEVVCSQICGLGHYKMRGKITVQKEEEYKIWLKSQEPASIYF